MTLEELKKLKEELLKQKKWFIISPTIEDISSDYIIDNLYSEDEIKSMEDTKGVLENCMSCLEEITKLLIYNDEDIEKIALGTMPMPIVSRDILKNKLVNKDEWNKSEKKELTSYFMRDYIYVDFDLDQLNTFISNKQYFDLNYGTKLYEKKEKYLKNILQKYKLSGIVKYDEFVKMINSLGYKIEFYSGLKAQTFDDYLDNCFEFCSLDVVADFKRVQIDENKFKKKIKV